MIAVHTGFTADDLPHAKFWTTRELDILREVYPVAGIAGVRQRLPNRTAATIKRLASRLGIPGRRRNINQDTSHAE